MTTSAASAAAPACNNNGVNENSVTGAAAVAAAAAASRAMQSDEDFNIRFVNLVRMHKCLYDKKVPEYRNRDNQEKSWTLISLETRESVIHCKERWRNLRACLSRYIKQQSGADPQHKPYYLTEHMAFLLPFLKSTRNSLDHCSSLASLFQAHQQQQLNTSNMQIISPSQLQYNGEQLELKQSLSDNEDEETMDAFDTTGSGQHHRRSPVSDTTSANTMQNFIPDVQLAELRTPDGSAAEIIFSSGTNHNNNHNHEHLPSHMAGHSRLNDSAHESKRIKIEPVDAAGHSMHGMHSMYSMDNPDMEFFRSILPDLAALTPQQKRKFKIGILELIDDVTEQYPVEAAQRNGTLSAAPTVGRLMRRNSAREARK